MTLVRATLAVALVLVFLASPPVSQAQPATKVWRIGYLGYAYPTEARDREAFRQRLHDLGYVEGKNLVIESRLADSSFERLPALSSELVGLKLDAIAAFGNPTIAALTRATQTIPIVMISAGDPVGVGLVSSLARPGGNVTGLASLAEGLSPKWLELLTQTVPGLTQVGVLMLASQPSHATFLREIKRAAVPEIKPAARQAGISVLGLEVQGRNDIERAFATLTKARAHGLVVLPSPIMLTNQTQILELAAKNRVPAIYPYGAFAEGGGLMAYSPNRTDMYRRSAMFVDRILKGAKPADLPIEQPTKFELVINTKTARALGLTIPPSLLLRADQVVE